MTLRDQVIEILENIDPTTDLGEVADKIIEIVPKGLGKLGGRPRTRTRRSDASPFARTVPAVNCTEQRKPLLAPNPITSATKPVDRGLASPKPPQNPLEPVSEKAKPLPLASPSGSFSDLISDPDQDPEKSQIGLEADPDPDLSGRDLTQSIMHGRLSAADEFDGFWALFPRKVGRKAAERAWRRLNPPLAQVKATLAWQVKSQQWRDGFIPHPTTWLNQGRWEDEPPRPLLPPAPLRPSERRWNPAEVIR